jgi:hypothetical protein
VAIDPNSDERQTDLVIYLEQLERDKAEARASCRGPGGGGPQLLRASSSEGIARARDEQSGKSGELEHGLKLAKCRPDPRLASA